MVWNFVLHLKGIKEFNDEISETLHEAFADGTLASSAGSARILFGRESATLNEAIRSAVNDVRKAGLEIDHVEIENEDLEETELAQWSIA